jgi:hypothetical protein
MARDRQLHLNLTRKIIEAAFARELQDARQPDDLAPKEPLKKQLAIVTRAWKARSQSQEIRGQ